ncbi:MAG: Gfo/Idh/MocA family oxidoreductase [Planctomycetota bacterium]
MATTRRDFLRAAALAPALYYLPGRPTRRGSPNEALRVAVIGIRSRGRDHIGGLHRLKDVEVVAVCDADRAFLDREVAAFAARGEKLAAETDYRRLLERKDLDAITIATPNHWHALMAIEACRAGKHVYVEKPVSHNVREGRALVAAARASKRCVQAGTQIRSNPAIAEAVEFVRSGALGAVTVARGLCYKPRRPIGKVERAPEPPATVDLDLWCGPAAKAAPRRAQFHYDWHWVWDTGNGDLGNQGIHQIDICRRFLGDPALPSSVRSVGGRFGDTDDGETPNTQIIRFAQGPAPILFEVRGLPRDAAERAGKWTMDDFDGARIGAVIHCERGRVVVDGYASARALDAEGKEIRRFRGGGDHYANFVDAIRADDPARLNGDVEQGHLSSALCHLGAISHRLGAAASPEEIVKALGRDAALSEAEARQRGHLAANGIDLAKTPLTLGPELAIDPGTETIRNREDAAPLLTRAYRKPFVLPGD